MTASAKAGIGASVGVGDAASPEVFTDIPEITTIGGPNIQAEQIENERRVSEERHQAREKLASEFDGRQFIQSVYGVGYRFEPE